MSDFIPPAPPEVFEKMAESLNRVFQSGALRTDFFAQFDGQDLSIQLGNRRVYIDLTGQTAAEDNLGDCEF